jgi:hypothetical protein
MLSELVSTKGVFQLHGVDGVEQLVLRKVIQNCPNARSQAKTCSSSC